MRTDGSSSWVRSAVFVLLFSAAVLLGRESRPAFSEVALVWPAAGVGAWWLMDLRGRRLAVDATLLVLLTVVLQLATGLPTTAALAFGVANLGHGLSARWAARRFWPGGPRLCTPGDAVRLLQVSALAGLVSGTVSALLAWQVLGGGLVDSCLLFVTRNAGTTFVVLALVLALRPPHRVRSLFSRRRAPEFVALLLLSVVLAVAVLSDDGALPVGFLVITLPLWAGARLGVPRAVAVSTLVSTVAVASTAAGSNALSDVSSSTQLTALVQVFTVLAVCIAVLLSTLQHERDDGTGQQEQIEAPRPDGTPGTAGTAGTAGTGARPSPQALHDPVTGLPNRMLLLDRLEHALAAAVRDTGVAVVHLHLDGFRGINEAFGAEVGDQVLVTTAERLQATLRPGDTVARTGGDEFVACCSDVGDAARATGLTARLVEVFAAPMLVGEHLLVVGVSAGVALSGSNETSVSLLRAADAAMHAAKAAGRGRVVTAWQDAPASTVPPRPPRPPGPPRPRRSSGQAALPGDNPHER